MRLACLFALAAAAAFAQGTPPGNQPGQSGQSGQPGQPGAKGPYGLGPGGVAPNWRGFFNGYFRRPPGSINMRDLQLLESQMALAGGYCTGLTPGDYESNRAMVRQMVTYLASVQALNQDPQMNLSLRRLTTSLGAWPCAYGLPPGIQPPPGAAAAPPPPVAGEPPFALHAPDLKGVAKADQQTANDLKERYEGVAARAASLWKDAETIRLGLAAKGMTLNADTASGLDRMKLMLDEAAGDLTAHKWTDAADTLDRTEYMMQKVGKTVGH